MFVKNKKNNEILATKIKTANNPFSRMIGLLGKDKLDTGEALHIIPCKSIHSFFMKFEFDVVFIDKNKQIKHIINSMQPWRVSKICFDSYSVLEMPAGILNSTKTIAGDFLEFIE